MKIQSNTAIANSNSNTSVDVDGVINGLSPFGKTASGDLNLRGSYHGEPSNLSIRDAWAYKDPAALQAWANAGVMGPVLSWIGRVNSGAGGDYLGRALAQNADSALWLQLLVRDGVVKTPSPEWRRAIEMASFTLDIGDDGAGRTGYSYVLTGVNGYPGSRNEVVGLPAGLGAHAAMLVGGSGSGGLYAETVFDSKTKASDFCKRLVREGTDIPDLLGHLSPTQRKVAEKDIAMLNDGSIVATQQGREAFADALLIVKMSDRSRGRALDLAQGKSGEEMFNALRADRDYQALVANFQKHKLNRQD